MKSLDKSRQAAPLRGRQQKCPGSPVVRPAVVEPGCGMLTERQMAWVDEFPHDSATENPVLYKYVFIQNLCIMFIIILSVSWTSTVKKDLDLLGLTSWDEALDLAKDRLEWRDCTARCASTTRGRTKV